MGSLDKELYRILLLNIIIYYYIASEYYSISPLHRILFYLQSFRQTNLASSTSFAPFPPTILNKPGKVC